MPSEIHLAVRVALYRLCVAALMVLFKVKMRILYAKVHVRVGSVVYMIVQYMYGKLPMYCRACVSEKWNALGMKD